MLLRSAEFDTLSDLFHSQAKKVAQAGLSPELAEIVTQGFEEASNLLLSLRDALYGNASTNSR